MKIFSMKKLLLSIILLSTFTAFAQTPDSVIVIKVAVPPTIDSSFNHIDTTISYNKGNLGVGTGAVRPAAKLEIFGGAGNEQIRISSLDGDGTANRYLSSSTYEYPILSYHAFSNALLQNATAQISFTDRPGTYTSNTAQRTSDILFKTVHNWNGTAFGQYMDNSLSIMADNLGGSVGIRTTAPTAALDVRGTVRLATGTSASGKFWGATDTLGNGTWLTVPVAYTDVMARSAISYTNTGNSGAGTYNSTTGVFNFPNYNITGLASFDSTKIKSLITAIPKADSAFAGYATKFDSVFTGGKWVITIRVDSAKIAADTKLGLTVTGTGGTYNSTTGVLNLTGGGGGSAAYVDTLTAQNVRGLKTFVGSSTSDLAPQTEQFFASGWTSTGWTGSFAAGFTNNAGNTTALTNSYPVLNNQLYLISYTITGRTAGSITIQMGGITISAVNATGTTSATTLSTAGYNLFPSANFDGTVVLSLKSIGFSTANSVFASSDLSNLFQIRIPSAAYSAGFGFNALRKITTGINNTAFGSNSQQSTTSGSGNISFGTNALAANDIGSNNTAVGGNAGAANTTGGTNAYFGYFAGSANTTGSSNVAMGGLSLFNSVTGSNNVAIGNNAGRYHTSSTNLVNCSNCTFLGSDTKAGADGLSNITAIGSGAVGLPVSSSVQIGASTNNVISLTGRVITGSLTDNGTDQLQVTGTAKITGQLNIPTGTLSTSAVNLAQMNAAITAGGGSTAAFVDTLNNQTVRGIKTFTSQPVIPTGTLGNSPVTLTQLNAATANIVSGTYTATTTNVTNAVSSSGLTSTYMRIGNIVHCKLTGNVTANATGAVVININLPISTTNASQPVVSTVSIKENGGTSYLSGEAGVNAATTAQLRFLATTTATATYAIDLDYQL